MMNRNYKNNRNDDNNLVSFNGDFTKEASKYINSKGKLKCKDKKLKKVLKDGFRYHVMKKNGKVKGTLIHDTDSEIATCSVTGDEVSIHLMDKDEYKEHVHDVSLIKNQLAYLSEAMQSSRGTKQLMSMSKILDKKAYKAGAKLVKAARKEDMLSTKKGKKKGGSGQSSFSNWKYR